MQVACHLPSKSCSSEYQSINSITFNTIFPWSFPVRHVLVLFRYLLNTYHHSFLKVFIICQLILKIFQPFCSSVKPFPDAPNITPKYFTFFSVGYIFGSYLTSIEFCVHLLLIKDSILSALFSSLLIFSYFLHFLQHPLL